MNYFIVIFLTAFLLALIFSPVAIKLAPKIGAVDIPKDNRRMHTKPMPRFGGMAIFIGTMVSLLLLRFFFMGRGLVMGEEIETDARLTGVIIGGVLIYCVGIVDDLKGMSPKVKFLCQVICGVIVYLFDIRIEFFTNHFGAGHSYLPGAISLIVTVIWIVGITNTINLIDGLDGLAVGVSCIASFSIAYTAYIHGMYLVALAMLAIGGAALGFIPFNFHPARIFMGDGGSLFLGFMLASISIIGPVKGATVLATVVPVLVLGVPIFDTAFAILRRLVNKRPIMEADKGHLHHRLMAAGLGQRRSVLTLYGISGVMGVAAILFSRDLFLESAGLFCIAATFIYIYLTDETSPFLKIRTAKVEKTEEKK